MPERDICQMKSRLLSTARDLESADSRQKLENCLRSQRRLWLSLRRNVCQTCHGGADLLKYADIVLDILRRHAFPDDYHISELVSINQRTSALLNERCPHQGLPLAGNNRPRYTMRAFVANDPPIA